LMMKHLGEKCGVFGPPKDFKFVECSLIYENS
jgi:hypothetical protein